MSPFLSRLLVATVLGASALPLTADLVRLSAAPSPADNPLKGLVPYQGDDRGDFPHSLEFNYLPLGKLIIGPDSYDWKPLDAMLDDIASRGNQAIFRLWLEYPRQPSGLPKYLAQQGVRVTTWEEPSAEISIQHFTPDYEDERLIAALENFIAALGQRYDGDPRIGFITAGILGSWGEWHTYPRPDLFASKSTQQRILAAYDQSFAKTPVQLRYPAGNDDAKYAPNAHLRLGYHDDSFAWGTLESGKGNEWFYLSLLRGAGSQAMEKWRTAPVGGEIRPELWGQIFDEKPAHPQAQDFAECVRQTHVSWLMDTGMFREKAAPARHASALRHVQAMGYDFHVQSAEITRAAESLTVSLKVINQGVAPFYPSWPLELAALDPTGTVQQKYPVDWSLTGLLPGDQPRSWTATLTIPKPTLPGQVLALRVIHPLPLGKPLRFANAEQNRTAPGWLTLSPLP